MPQGDLHSYAVAAEENLEKLATGLAQAGADENTVEAVTRMASVVRQIVRVLGKGQEQTSDEEPPEQQPEEPERRETLDSATDSLQQEVARKAAERRAREQR